MVRGAPLISAAIDRGSRPRNVYVYGTFLGPLCPSRFPSTAASRSGMMTAARLRRSGMQYPWLFCACMCRPPCATCATAYERVAHVRQLRPHQPIEVVDLDQAGTERPSTVFGTPTYCLDDRVISLGNPSLS